MMMYRMLLILSFVHVYAREKASVIILNDGDWTNMLTGEWMVAFYAPWCPACQALGPTWDKVASWSEDLDIKVAKIDVTQNPALSGRFLVTALPTIYHVKDGQFRIYPGARSDNDIISFVDEKKYQGVEPLPWYKSPTTIHMSIMGSFFKFSMHIRNIHTALTEEYGVPFWGSYLLFAAATIIVGLLLGLILVVICDFAFPPKYQTPPLPKQYDSLVRQNAKVAGDTSKDEESDILDDRSSTNDKTPEGKKDDSRSKNEQNSKSADDLRKRKAKAKTAD